MSCRVLTNCLACNGKNLFPYLDLGQQFPANSYEFNTNEEVVFKTKYPLQVNFCKDCWHSQLSIQVSPETLYSNYLYVSGTSQTAKKHFEDLVETFGDSTSPYQSFARTPEGGYKKRRVLEIGSNEGTLLKMFKDKGFEVLGVDPAENLRPLSEAKDVPTLVEFFGKETWLHLEGKFDIVLALNAFAHNGNPYECLMGIKRILHPWGEVILEFPLWTNSLDKQDIGQIYHEHLSYFTASSFMALCERAGFTICDVLELPEVHGGTVRFTLVQGGIDHCTDFKNLLRREYKKNLGDTETYIQFADKAKKSMKLLADEVRDLSSTGHKVIFYGASAKLMTMLQYHLTKDIYKSYVSYIVDDNPLKCNGRTPGGSFLIVKSSILVNEDHPKLAIICGVHNMYTEVKNRLQSMGVKCKLINYVPKITVEEI